METNFVPIVLISIASFMNNGNFKDRNVAISKTNKLWKLTKTLTKVTWPVSKALLNDIWPINPSVTVKSSIKTKAYLNEKNVLTTSFLTLGSTKKESELKVAPK